MKITKEHVRAQCDMQGLSIPEDELEDIATRMSIWFGAMEQIEAELGDQINATDPIPPIYPNRDF